MQEKCVRNKDNVYQLYGWEEFVTGKKWVTYCNVV